MNHHLHQWIANVFIGAIDSNDVIDAIDYHSRLWKTHRHEMALMEPFYLIYWSPMVIVNGASGAIKSIDANGSPLAPLFVAISANGANGANGEKSKL